MSLKAYAAAASVAQVVQELDKVTPEEFDAVNKVIDEEHARLEAQALDAAPPRQLSNEPTDPFFRPDYMRVGVKIDGVERKDVAWYNADHRVYKTVGGGSYGADSVVPFWRRPTTRQERRAVARFLEKRKRK